MKVAAINAPPVAGSSGGADVLTNFHQMLKDGLRKTTPKNRMGAEVFGF
jgi:hypothetical protein